MNLKQLITKLQGKPNQDAEVEFVVYETKSNDLVCVDLSGKKTIEIMRVLAGKKK